MLTLKDKNIIKGIKEKKDNSLDELIDEYGKLVFYIINSILKEKQENSYIDDCYNDVFTTVWFNIDCFDEDYGNFKGWIVSITKYKAMDIKRKIYKDNILMEFIDELTPAEEADLEKIENEEIINNILKSLEDKDKLIFIKRYIHGYSIKEIAKELGYTENYIYTRISRGRKKLKNIQERMV